MENSNEQRHSGIRICPTGRLAIRKKGRWMLQRCPYTRSFFCGDQCTFFGSPVIDKDVVKIELCHGQTIYCKASSFRDDRREDDTTRGLFFQE